MERKLSKADRTKQFIIETTAGIFNTKGYAATSMSDITEATSLTKGSVYGNFENKEELALAVFDYNLSKVSQGIKDYISRASNYRDKLLAYAKFYHSYNMIPFMKGGCPILNTAVEADDTNPLLQQRVARAIINWKKDIITILEAGMNAGEFKEDVDVNQFAFSIIALLEGGIMISKATNSRSNLDEVLKTVEFLISQITI